MDFHDTCTILNHHMCIMREHYGVSRSLSTRSHTFWSIFTRLTRIAPQKLTLRFTDSSDILFSFLFLFCFGFRFSLFALHSDATTHELFFSLTQCSLTHLGFTTITSVLLSKIQLLSKIKGLSLTNYQVDHILAGKFMKYWHFN
jgi:hypothetical protein